MFGVDSYYTSRVYWPSTGGYTINWFGPESWGAPVCDDAPRCEPPVGNLCVRCSEPIRQNDSGVTMPGSAGPVTYHLDCHLKSVLNHEQWGAAGLVPTSADGEILGDLFVCRHCRMCYSFSEKRWWQL